jgi:hypothetical protein
VPDLGLRNARTSGEGVPTFPSERLRERQEAAGCKLRSRDKREGCLLFARRNGSMPLLDSCSVISPRYLVFITWRGCPATIICISVGSTDTLGVVLNDPEPERRQGTRTVGRSWALMNGSGFSFFWGARRSEVGQFRCRRVVCSIERLRERQEAAGNGLYNQAERGGCLLFARRNGSEKNGIGIREWSVETRGRSASGVTRTRRTRVASMAKRRSPRGA